VAHAIPSPWVAVVLTLGTFRLLRLLGWDEFPPVLKAREWLLHGRPLLGDLWGCPFCLGWWLSLAVYLLWLWQPTGTLYGAAPFALSGAVGLIAKNLDA
jgi:hypothetical protein